MLVGSGHVRRILGALDALRRVVRRPQASLGTSIVDISDPANPKVVSTITLEDRTSHSHKARVIGDVMIVNHERNNQGIGRKAEQLGPMRARLVELLGRDLLEVLEKAG